MKSSLATHLVALFLTVFVNGKVNREYSYNNA